jgi:hypothetical protein
MKGEKDKFFKRVFLVAAIYDFILGALFLLFYKPIFSFFNIAAPAPAMYLQMSAAFVIAMGFGYYLVYKNLHRNADLVKLGISYKAVYAALAFYFYFNGLAHFVFFLFAIFDLIFLGLFVYFLSYSKKK